MGILREAGIEMPVVGHALVRPEVLNCLLLRGNGETRRPLDWAHPDPRYRWSWKMQFRLPEIRFPQDTFTPMHSPLRVCAFLRQSPIPSVQGEQSHRHHVVSKCDGHPHAGKFPILWHLYLDWASLMLPTTFIVPCALLALFRPCA